MSDPKITVVIPTYNGAAYLREAIQSVLHQTRPAHELIVVDDGSSDNSAEIAVELVSPEHVIKQANQGAAVAINTGIAHSSGDLIALLDHDDLWAPDKLERQCQTLEREREYEAVFGLVQQFISPDASDETRATVHCPDMPQPGLSASALLVRRSALERIGPFRGIGSAAFPEWFALAQLVGLRYAVPDYLVA
jgi:glycosyltransferase involved in cell wall biosynthesis